MTAKKSSGTAVKNSEPAVAPTSDNLFSAVKVEFFLPTQKDLSERIDFKLSVMVTGEKEYEEVILWFVEKEDFKDAKLLHKLLKDMDERVLNLKNPRESIAMCVKMFIEEYNGVPFDVTTTPEVDAIFAGLVDDIDPLLGTDATALVPPLNQV